MTHPNSNAREAQAGLLDALDRSLAKPGAEEPHPALSWASSGAMALTGHPDGPPRLAPANLANASRRAARWIHEYAGTAATRALDGAELLGERAAIAGLQRAGSQSPGGTCRIVPAADGWIAANLPRPDDQQLLPAWLGEGSWEDPWDTLAARAESQPRDALVGRARLLGLAVAPVRPPPTTAPPWYAIAARGRPRDRANDTQPRVLDLSALWAGPLCAHLLGLAGAEVIKVESESRPDGARSGPAAFFDLMNAGKKSVALDFGAPRDLERLRHLISTADIVIESARPRALRQLGIDAEHMVAQNPGLTWLSITGYGRQGDAAHWVAFGDDAAAAAGLAMATDPDAPIFCGDAIADPLTGLHAAVACLVAWQHGGGVLLDIALSRVVAHLIASEPSAPARVEARPDGDGWAVIAGSHRREVRTPRARTAAGAARALGADTDAVFEEIARSC